MPEPVGATTRALRPAPIAVPGALLRRGGRAERGVEPRLGRCGNVASPGRLTGSSSPTAPTEVGVSRRCDAEAPAPGDLGVGVGGGVGHRLARVLLDHVLAVDPRRQRGKAPAVDAARRRRAVQISAMPPVCLPQWAAAAQIGSRAVGGAGLGSSTVPDEPMVLARGLVKRFGDFTAVDGIDVDVARGEAFGFLGPNGAGKSSTMRMIGCVSPVTDGHAAGARARPGGRRSADPGPARRRAAGGHPRLRAAR